MKLPKGAEVLLLLLLLSRARRTARGGGMGNWTPPPGPEGLNVPVIPMPPNPLEQEQ